MMKKFMTLCLSILVSYGVSAQFYLDINGGYGFGFPANVLGQSTEYSAVTSPANISYKSQKNLYGSIGQGAVIQLTPGYMFNDYIGLELGINYFLGAKTTISESKTYFTSTTFNYDNEPWGEQKTVAHSNQLRILPTVIVSTGMSKRISAYAKLGIVMPVYGKVFASVDSTYLDKMIPNKGPKFFKDKINAEVEGSPSIGFRGAIGINFKITENWSVFGEVYATSLNIKSKSQKVVHYNRDGVDLDVSGLPAYDTQIEYVDKLDGNSNNKEFNHSLDPSVDASYAKNPKQEIAPKTSFSQLGIQVGVKYVFGKK